MQSSPPPAARHHHWRARRAGLRAAPRIAGGGRFRGVVLRSLRRPARPRRTKGYADKALSSHGYADNSFCVYHEEDDGFSCRSSPPSYEAHIRFVAPLPPPPPAAAAADQSRGARIQQAVDAQDVDAASTSEPPAYR